MSNTRNEPTNESDLINAIKEFFNYESKSVQNIKNYPSTLDNLITFITQQEEFKKPSQLKRVFALLNLEEKKGSHNQSTIESLTAIKTIITDILNKRRNETVALLEQFLAKEASKGNHYKSMDDYFNSSGDKHSLLINAIDFLIKNHAQLAENSIIFYALALFTVHMQPKQGNVDSQNPSTLKYVRLGEGITNPQAKAEINNLLAIGFQYVTKMPLFFSGIVKALKGLILDNEKLITEDNANPESFSALKLRNEALADLLKKFQELLDNIKLSVQDNNDNLVGLGTPMRATSKLAAKLQTKKSEKETCTKNLFNTSHHSCSSSSDPNSPTSTSDLVPPKDDEEKSSDISSLSSSTEDAPEKTLTPPTANNAIQIVDNSNPPSHSQLPASTDSQVKVTNNAVNIAINWDAIKTAIGDYIKNMTDNKNCFSLFYNKMFHDRGLKRAKIYAAAFENLCDQKKANTLENTTLKLQVLIALLNNNGKKLKEDVKKILPEPERKKLNELIKSDFSFPNETIEKIRDRADLPGWSGKSDIIEYLTSTPKIDRSYENTSAYCVARSHR